MADRESPVPSGDDLPRGRLTSLSVVEPGGLHEPGVAPAIQNDSRDVAPRVDFRYGGNEAWQKEFHSGCIVCLYSCPGGAIGNHAHTIRDYVRDGVIYASRPERLPRSGSKVTIILKVGGV